MIKVVILGSGNVGRHLFKAFKNNSEIEITQWYSRNIKDIHPYSDFVEITNANYYFNSWPDFNCSSNLLLDPRNW